MAAVHALPVMHSYHSRQSLNGVNTVNAAGPSVLPTPPVASRKRKRAQQYTVSYSEVQETDSDGRVRDVIVIEDTPPPTMSPATTHGGGYSAPYQPPIFTAPIRTRARAAAEAQALSASISASGVAPPPKKRKRDPADEIRALPAKKAAASSQNSLAITQTKSWGSRSAAATDEVTFHFSPLLTNRINHCFTDIQRAGVIRRQGRTLYHRTRRYYLQAMFVFLSWRVL